MANAPTVHATDYDAVKVALAFLKGKGKDHKGRTWQDYLEMDEEMMEHDHEWVQWAFPIDTVSPHNPYAGLLFSSDAPHFKRNGIAYKTQLKLLRKYLCTIGINISTPDRTMIDANKFFDVISTPNNHHMKRISRVFKHLILTNDAGMARFILHCMTRDLIAVNPEGFTSYTVAYWNAVVYRYDYVFRKL